MDSSMPIQSSFQGHIKLETVKVESSISIYLFLCTREMYVLRNTRPKPLPNAGMLKERKYSWIIHNDTSIEWILYCPFSSYWWVFPIYFSSEQYFPIVTRTDHSRVSNHNSEKCGAIFKQCNVISSAKKIRTAGKH